MHDEASVDRLVDGRKVRHQLLSHNLSERYKSCVPFLSAPSRLTPAAICFTWEELVPLSGAKFISLRVWGRCIEPGVTWGIRPHALCAAGLTIVSAAPSLIIVLAVKMYCCCCFLFALAQGAVLRRLLSS